MVRVFILLVAIFVLPSLAEAQSYSCNGQTYGTYARPFHCDSMWNKPLQNGAIDVDADWNASKNFHSVEEVLIHQVNLSNPTRNSYSKTSDAYCASLNTGITHFTVPLPDSLLVESRRSNGIAVFVWPDGSVMESYLWQKCSIQAPHAGGRFLPSSTPYNISGDGNPTRGAQLGSEIGALGGTIRSGELTTAPGVEINHALKCTLTGLNKYFNASDPQPGWKWPAKVDDGNASTNYIGTNQHNKIGALYRLPANYNCSANMVTEPGRKVCEALRVYGCFDVDSHPNTSAIGFQIGVEIASPTDRTVPNQMLSTYNINMTSPSASTASGQWRDDLHTMYNAMRVVTNNSETFPKGPPAPSVASAQITNANQNRITVTISNPGAAPMVPATGITGWSYSCTVTSGASTTSKATDSGIHIELNSGNFDSSDVCTVSYSQTGNYTNSDGIELVTTTGFTVTNNILVAAPTVRQVGYGCLQPHIAETSRLWTATQRNVQCLHPSTRPVTVVVPLRVEAGNLQTIPRLWCDDGLGAGYYRVEDTYGVNGYRFATDTVLPHGATRSRFTEFSLAGSFVSDASRHHGAPNASFPPVNVSFSASPVGVKQFEMSFSVRSQRPVGSVTTCQVRYEDGTAFTVYDHDISLRVGNPWMFSYGGGW